MQNNKPYKATAAASLLTDRLMETALEGSGAAALQSMGLLLLLQQHTSPCSSSEKKN